MLVRYNKRVQPEAEMALNTILLQKLVPESCNSGLAYFITELPPRHK
jgi:hypothetical protein